MAINASIYIPTDLQKALSSRRLNEAEKLGMQIRVLAERALAALEAEKRVLSFTESEWLLILDSLNGELPNFDLVRHIGTNVQDNIELNAAHRQYGVTDAAAADVAARVNALPVGAKWAILDVAEQFWGRGIEPSAEGLKSLGVLARER